MKRYLAISIDVEPDCSPNWQYSSPLTFSGVTKGIGERLQPIFEKYNIIPTYLINNVVLEDDASVSYLKNMKGQFELGTHLHPEFVEPEKKFFDYAGKSGRANCCFYSPQIEKEKIITITSLFEKKIGYKPVSFRAGRFSAGINTINILSELNYKVDSSVTPHICWNDTTRERPVDFTHAPEQPYLIKNNSLLEAGENGTLLQVPVTIGLLRRNPAKEFLSAMGGFRHSLRKFKPVWLRPHYSSFDEMKQLVDLFTSKYQHNQVVVFNMMFHNVEVLPGLSPYTSSEEDCKHYLDHLETFFSFCNQQNIQSTSLSNLYDVFKK